MDELEKIKERISRETIRDDRANACAAVGVSTTVFRTAMKKTRLSDLTDAEEKVLDKVREILDERILRKQRILNPVTVCNS